MDNSLRALCDAIKKILSQLKPQVNHLSFIIVTGKNEQGKSALLRQSAMEELPVFSEQHAKIYFNQKGILLELGENWLANSKVLLHDILKQLNRCSPYLKITGLIFCIDVNDLLIAEHSEFAETKKSHLQLLERMGKNLGYPVELALLFTKMDTLAGFSEFYHMEHPADLCKPLGFSLECLNQSRKKIETYTLQFNQFIEQLAQQVIAKIHPIRSTIKRSLIRELPLQLASLNKPILSFIQGISPKLFHLHSLYFTSAEQGGLSIDRLNKKIQHEYALMVQDTFPQATNYKAHFVEGALKIIQEQCSQAPQGHTITRKPLVAIACSIATLGLIILSYNHFKTTHLLDEASKELLAYDNLNNQKKQSNQALYHLSKAAKNLDQITSNPISMPTVHQLKHSLHHNAQQQVEGAFIPSLTSELEKVISSANHSPISRYHALKIYLMLNQPEHLSKKEVEEWFTKLWKSQSPQNYHKQLTLLQNTLNKPMQPIPVKQAIISDARNYLNALPTSYLYYSVAKEYFPQENIKIDQQGFQLSTDTLPIYFTKAGFKKIIQDIPNISSKLQTENWILAHQDLTQLPDLLTQAYCYDYVSWWQTFMKKSQPIGYQDFQQGQQITKNLQQSKAITKLISLVQQETKPDLTETNSQFNQLIAHQFTDLNLMSLSATQELQFKLSELERFLATLSVVNDGGKTAFNITKLRFTNEYASDAVSSLFNQSKQLPQPLNGWAQKIAGDAWVILIRESRQYINQQWQLTVYNEFKNTIAHKYPFENNPKDEIQLDDFNRFFSTHGVLNAFSEQFIKPFLDVSNAEWKPKAVNDFVMPITVEAIDQIIRANIITNMFFPELSEQAKIEFSLQKINLDPVVSSLKLEIGQVQLMDTQESDSLTRFTWPQSNAKLSLNSIEGNHYELSEQGAWAVFKLLEKVNVLVDEQDSSSLQILFEVNSNSGRYLLKTHNKVNPFAPGILNGFALNESIL